MRVKIVLMCAQLRQTEQRHDLDNLKTSSNSRVIDQKRPRPLPPPLRKLGLLIQTWAVFLHLHVSLSGTQQGALHPVPVSRTRHVNRIRSDLIPSALPCATLFYRFSSFYTALHKLSRLRNMSEIIGGGQLSSQQHKNKNTLIKQKTEFPFVEDILSMLEQSLN